jgi:hypothetical protein
MTSSMAQRGTLHPGWLTEPVQVPPKAARPEDTGGAGEALAVGTWDADGPGRGWAGDGVDRATAPG